MLTFLYFRILNFEKCALIIEETVLVLRKYTLKPEGVKGDDVWNLPQVGSDKKFKREIGKVNAASVHIGETGGSKRAPQNHQKSLLIGYS